MKVVLFGPPGAGKGTQARILGSARGWVVLTSGDMVRAMAARPDEPGLGIKQVMESGALIDDQLMIGAVEARLSEDDCRESFILDGFPRTLVQASALDQWLERLQARLDRVIEIQVGDDFLIERITGRFGCVNCGAGYHDLHRPTEVSGICDECGSSHLERRSDDGVTAVRNRLAQYHARTSPLLPYYRQQGLLYCVPGLGPVQEVSRRISEIINGLGQ